MPSPSRGGGLGPGVSAAGVSAAGVSATARRPVAVADRAYDVRLGPDESATFLGRVRSSVALLVLLAAVGTTVALGIGAVMFLVLLALRHTVR